MEDLTNFDLEKLCDKYGVSKKGGKLDMIGRITKAKKSQVVEKEEPKRGRPKKK